MVDAADPEEPWRIGRPPIFRRQGLSPCAAMVSPIRQTERRRAASPHGVRGFMTRSGFGLFRHGLGSFVLPEDERKGTSPTRVSEEIGPRRKVPGTAIGSHSVSPALQGDALGYQTIRRNAAIRRHSKPYSVCSEFPTCCATAAVTSLRTRGTTHGRYKRGLGTATFSTRCATPS